MKLMKFGNQQPQAAPLIDEWKDADAEERAEGQVLGDG